MSKAKDLVAELIHDALTAGPGELKENQAAQQNIFYLVALRLAGDQVKEATKRKARVTGVELKPDGDVLRVVIKTTEQESVEFLTLQTEIST